MSVCHNSEYIMIFFLHVASNPAHWVSTDNCGPLGSSYMGLDSIRAVQATVSHGFTATLSLEPELLTLRPSFFRLLNVRQI